MLANTKMRDQTFMTLMKLLPKSAISSAVGQATRLPAPAPLHRIAMRVFARRFRVAMDEAERDFSGYSTFGEFFARRLKPGVRSVEAGERVVVSPVDGAVSHVGYAENGQCIQAKGIEYPLARLLDDDQAAAHFSGGAYATLYLSPRDYHRIHAPLGGTITGYHYVPGEFWPVNPASVRSKRSLFCVNERLITYLSTPAGRVAVVAVGATCVARIRAAYTNLITHQGQAQKTHQFEPPIAIEKGSELAAFEMGSTVILVFEPKRLRWESWLLPEAPVRFGQRLGEVA